MKKDGSIINLVFVDGIHLQVRDEDKKGSRLVMGATTLSILTLSIITLSKTTFSIMGFL